LQGQLAPANAGTTTALAAGLLVFGRRLGLELFVADAEFCATVRFLCRKE
jgi:hypothetical protein